MFQSIKIQKQFALVRLFGNNSKKFNLIIVFVFLNQKLQNMPYKELIS